MKIIGIIPARYASTRFPAKALADIKGKTMIRRVYEQSSKCLSLNKVLVATDHPKIFNEIKTFGGEVVMTSSCLKSGTDRCYLAYKKLDEHFDYVINIQGDEPFINPSQITLLAQILKDKAPQVATLAIKITDSKTLFDSNVVKVVMTKNGNALYFCRQTIPFIRDVKAENWLNKHSFYKHLGIYAYDTESLGKFIKMKPSLLECSESLEQLRWLENGYQIKVGISNYDSLGIDTPSDLELALKKLHKR